MIDTRILKAHGVSSSAYKKIFSAEPATYPKGVKRLVDNISCRIKDGRILNLKEWRAYSAIDMAYEVPFNQTTPTIIQHILANHLNIDETHRELANWGLKEEELYLKIPNPSTGVAEYVLNIPVFFQILVPLVKAYVGIRGAHLFNQLNQQPLLEFLPLKQTDRNKVACEALTDLIDTQSTWYGYSAVMRQAIMQMLRYGTMFAFPLEEWHCEKQLMSVVQEEGLEQEEPIVVKEGLRYAIPHPTRIGYDLKYPATTINSDSGTEYGFFWRVMSYGNILDSPLYWNRKSIFSGSNWFLHPSAGNYFTEIYPCQVAFPHSFVYASAELRDEKSAWYSTGGRDQSVFVTEYFEKLIPKQWGLADYKYPVWHRFTVAGDDTIIWAAPCAYNPIWFMGYDYDENAGRTASMALEVIPWQDHVGNLLTQMILTAKQNLGKVIFYDTNIVNKEDIDRLRNMGETRYRAIQYIGYDSLQTRVAGLNQASAFQVPNFGQQASVIELIQIMPTVLSIMERVLQISAQESGAQASHQQSKEEIIRTGSASTNRSTFIMSSVKEGMQAWKTQLYEANMAYRDPEFAAQVSADIPELDTILAAMGLTPDQKGKEYYRVRGQITRLRVEGFAASAEGAPKQPDQQVAQVIFQTVAAIANNPVLAPVVGAKNLLSLLEFGAQLGGAPRGWKLKYNASGESQQQVPPNVLEAIKAANQAVMQQVSEQVAKPTAEKIAGQDQQLQQLQAMIKQLQGIYDLAAKMTDKTEVEKQKAQIQSQIKGEQHTQDMRQKMESHQLDMQIKTEQAMLDNELTAQKASADVAAAEEKTAATVAATEEKTAATVSATEEKTAAQAKAKPKPQ